MTQSSVHDTKEMYSEQGDVQVAAVSLERSTSNTMFVAECVHCAVCSSKCAEMNGSPLTPQEGPRACTVLCALTISAHVVHVKALGGTVLCNPLVLG